MNKTSLFNLSDIEMIKMSRHEFNSRVYTARLSDQEVRKVKRLRRNAQSRLHPIKVKREMDEMKRSIQRLEEEKRKLLAERMGLELEIEVLDMAIKKETS